MKQRWVFAGILAMAAAMGWAAAAGADDLTVEFTFSPEEVTLTPAGEYTAISLADGSRVVDEVGAPSIPARFANILVPAGAQNISVSASGDGTLLAEGITPYPAQPRRPKSQARAAFVLANDRYASAEAWPAEVAVGTGDHDMQGYRFVSVRVNPLVYMGAEQKLYLRERVTVTVSYEVGAAPRAISSKQSSLFGSLVASLVVNPETAADYAPVTRSVEPKAALDYLIITSAGLSNAFQQVADYRSSAIGGGYTTRVLTTNTIGVDYSGTDLPAKIRACISNSVSTMGTTMVLLGGDDTIVPVRYCYVTVGERIENNMPTDLYYSGLSGSWNANGNDHYGETSDGVDMAWDVVVGRLPMRTAVQVTNYLNKVVAYESGFPVANKVILSGAKAWDTYSGSDRPTDDVTIDGHPGFRSTSPSHDTISDSEAWLRRLYRDGIYSNWPATVGILCDTITSWDIEKCGDYEQNWYTMEQQMNQNWTHLMFSGHGSPSYFEVESGRAPIGSILTGMTTFVYTDACLTGHFDKDANSIGGVTYTTEPCLGESFLRNPLGGALAYMGCARDGWGERDVAPASNTSDGGPSTVYAYKFYQRMYETEGRTLGVAFAMHKADMISLSNIDNCERWIQYGVNLLGDPSLKMPMGSLISTTPTFGANPGPIGATTSLARAFTVTAGGFPTPVLALRSQTASSDYSFVPETGILTYTPPPADVGTRTFTFVATNIKGSATQSVSVIVTSPTPVLTKIVNAAMSASGSMSIQIPTTGGIMYELQYTTNLLIQPMFWQSAISTNGTGAIITLEDGTPADDTRFYRVVTP